MKYIPLLFFMLTTSCAYSIHNVYVSGFEPHAQRTEVQTITAHGEQFVLLGFKQETDYVNAAYAQLEAQCSQGDIVGIVTEYQTATGLLSWNNHVYMKGLCVGPKLEKH